MSRIEGTRRGPVARFAAWYSRRSFGKVPVPLEVTAHSPWILRGYVSYEYGLERASKGPDRKLMELAQQKAASVVGCEWCLDIGSAILEHAGMTEEQIRDIPRHSESEHFSDDEKLVLDYAAAISRTPVSVPDELFERLRQRFGPEQIVELTAAIAWENYRARFNWALDIEPQGFARGVCTRPEHAALSGSPG
jgi:AhpD family alkylhydroperoxidase